MRECYPLWLGSFLWEASCCMYQPVTEEGLTQNSWAVGCLFLAHATSFNSVWTLTHPFPDSPVLSFQPVLGGLTGMFWTIVTHQGPALLQTWFFLAGGVVYRFSPMFHKSPLIHSRIHYRFYAAHLIKSSNKASPRHDASSQHRRTLFQKSWSSSPGQAGLRVSASLSLLPWDTATLVIQESTPTATVQQTPAAGSLMTFERSWSLLVTSLCCWGGLAWMARPQRVNSSFERPLLVVYFPDTRTVDFKFFWDLFKSLTTMISRFNLVSNCLRSHTSVWFHPF